MLDIKFILENKDLVQDAANKKKIDFNVDELISVYNKRNELLVEIERLRAEQNSFNRDIASIENEDEKAVKIEGMRVIKEKLKDLERVFNEIDKKYWDLMMAVPNVPDPSVPVGDGEEDNVPVEYWGDKPEFDFEPRSHIEIMENLGMVDFKRGAKVHGFRGYFLMGDGALMSFAIWQLAYEFFSKKGFEFVIPPIILKKKFFYATGHLPHDVDDIYVTQDDDMLAGTAEVPIMAFHSDEILDSSELPKRYLGFSPCYRREAGSYGKDVKGLIRVNEFYKWEQVILCKASHMESEKFFEEINGNVEEFLRLLGIPYRRLLICTGDLSQSKVKQYDVETWVPREGRYREISSASYFHDFQTRRFGIRYRDEDGKIKYAHSLNCTAIPTPRILVSIIENYQTAEGYVRVPESLVKYMGKNIIKGSE